jgi:hypothetical protein
MMRVLRRKYYLVAPMGNDDDDDDTWENDIQHMRVLRSGLLWHHKSLPIDLKQLMAATESESCIQYNLKRRIVLTLLADLQVGFDLDFKNEMYF